jgi:GalNAc-alpha-(1->4)-GalNAc-alpha-(1->3)-diNAcBac-PP-undecaprenol alpha-1,4-N-acetyl-D-galactosaminyltransferase
MNIMFLVSSLQFGGAERVATVLCNEFSRNHDVTLVATYGGLDPSVFDVDPAIKLHYLGHKYPCWAGQSAGSIPRLMKLRYLFKSCKPDVVVSFLPNVNVMAVLANIGLNIPLIISERSDPEYFPMSRFWKIMCKYSYYYADMLTVQTDAVAKKAFRIFNLPPLVRVVPNPIPSSLLDVQPSQKTEKRNILCLGRLMPSKQFDHVINAFSKIASSAPAWELHILGEGPAKAKLQELVLNLGLTDKVKFFGSVVHPYSQLAACDIFAMASLFEGFPNALLEALALGRPTVVYDCPSGPADITVHGSIAKLIPLNAEHEFSLALEELIRDENMRLLLGERARNSVLERYALSSVVEHWYQLIAEAIAHRTVRN